GRWAGKKSSSATGIAIMAWHDGCRQSTAKPNPKGVRRMRSSLDKLRQRYREFRCRPQSRRPSQCHTLLPIPNESGWMDSAVFRASGAVHANRDFDELVWDLLDRTCHKVVFSEWL